MLLRIFVDLRDEYARFPGKSDRNTRESVFLLLPQLGTVRAKSDISEKLFPQFVWPERTLEMNVSPSPAGHLFFDRFEKFVFKKKLDRNFQISDFKNFRFKISKILLLKFNFFQKFWKMPTAYGCRPLSKNFFGKSNPLWRLANGMYKINTKWGDGKENLPTAYPPRG